MKSNTILWYLPRGTCTMIHTTILCLVTQKSPCMALILLLAINFSLCALLSVSLARNHEE